MSTVDIGVFAHNEAAGICGIINELARQDILTNPNISARVLILANGCSDDTVERAKAAIAQLPQTLPFEVVDLAVGGKSRTWNTFVHELSRPDALGLIFCDADIEIPAPDVLSRLVGMLSSRSELAVANSRPVKDIVARPQNLSGFDKLISAAGGTLDNWRTAICGQLYCLRADTARTIHLPIGLPVEDGFVRAMVLTSLFSEDEHFERIDGTDDVYHVYKSERSIGALIHHQTRIVIGSSINNVIFEHLSSIPKELIPQELVMASLDANWLPALLRQRLPTWPYGWIPVHFLVKRVTGWLQNPSGKRNIKSMAVIAAGFCFDAVVYLLAQLKMARGAGAGYW